MQALNIEETKFTMKIDFDPITGFCSMDGNSYPEDAISFFEPIVDWLKDYISQVKGPVKLRIRLNYLNSSSSKCFMDIFDTLDDYHVAGGDVFVEWVYNEDDDEIHDSGEELLEDMSFRYEFVVENN